MEKNIHILPTDKPSRLYIGNNGNFVFGIIQTYIKSKNEDFTNQNIYITSEEEIKEGDWFIHFSSGYTTLLKAIKVESKVIKDSEGLNCWVEYSHKIILTTDLELIKNGVQAIDDEFLEWFVNNPNCEFVDVEKELRFDAWKRLQHDWYKIIIPKEEPKRQFVNNSSRYKDEDFTKEETVEKALTQQFKYDNLHDAKETMSKITVEEDAETRFAPFRATTVYNEGDITNLKYGFIEGAKWQEQRMYSEEEVLSILKKREEDLKFDINTNFDYKDTKKWFEQFKKK